MTRHYKTTQMENTIGTIPICRNVKQDQLQRESVNQNTLTEKNQI